MAPSMLATGKVVGVPTRRDDHVGAEDARLGLAWGGFKGDVQVGPVPCSNGTINDPDERFSRK